MNLDLLLEAERRGILPPEKAELLAEARKRGLVDAPAGGVSTNVQTPAVPQEKPGLANQAVSGMYEGLAGMFGSVVDIPEAIGDAALGGVDAIAGTQFQDRKRQVREAMGPPIGSSEALTNMFNDVGVLSPQPDTRVGQFVRGMGQEAGYSVIPGGLAARKAGVLPTVATEIMSALGGQTGATVAEEMGASQSVQDLARMAGNIGLGAPTAMATSRAKPPKAPTTEELYEQASRGYEAGRTTGQTASPKLTMSVVDEATDLLKREGLVRPDGSIPKGYTKVTDALETLMVYGDNSMTPIQMQNVRRQIAEAARQPGPEGRIGSIILKQFDDKMGPLVPDFEAANSAYARAKRSDLIEGRVDKAERRAASGGTGGNEVNAIRQNIRGILDNDNLRAGFSPDQIAAMEAIVRGDNVTNNLRRIGKLSPTSGTLPFILSGGGVAASSGDPIVLALIGAAEGAKRGAEALTQRQVTQLAEAIRRGAPVNTKGLSEGQKAIIMSLMASQTPTLAPEGQSPTQR